MNPVLTCFLAGAMALSLQTVAAAQDEAAPPAESKPVPLTDPSAAMDLLAEDKNGDILGIVFDVALDDSGKAKTIVLELFEEGEDEAAAENEGAAAGPPPAVEDTEAEEPEAPAEGEEAGTGEMTVGRLVGVSPQGAMVDTGRDVIVLPSVTMEQVQSMPEFNYEAGMKTVGHPNGYPAE